MTEISIHGVVSFATARRDYEKNGDTPAFSVSTVTIEKASGEFIYINLFSDKETNNV